MSELLPCPFCGGQSEPLNFVGHGFVSYSARCKECHAIIPYFDSEEKAIKAWNTRAYEEKNDANN